MINKRGPRTEPCGTPADISQCAEELFLKQIFVVWILNTFKPIN
jgi:hypothetical protein